MILHIFNDQRKFSVCYFTLLHKAGVPLEDHAVLHYGVRDNSFQDIPVQVTFLGSFLSVAGNVKLLRQLKKADKIIIHSLASPFLLMCLALSKRIAKKCVWVIWGKDLYFYRSLRHPLPHHRVYEMLRKAAIKNIPAVVTILAEEYPLLRQWYGVSPKHMENNDLYHLAIDTTIQPPRVSEKPYTIWLGNSGSRTNRHIEALHLLMDDAQSIGKIYAPLSYGGQKSYVKQVAAEGKRLFGEKFVPLLDFIPQKEYFSLLAQVDIGVFNHNRQEGLGNIWSLIFGGKMVYISRETATDAFFHRIGVQTGIMEDIRTEGIALLEERILAQNTQNLSRTINEAYSVEKWKQIFDM